MITLFGATHPLFSSLKSSRFFSPQSKINIEINRNCIQQLSLTNSFQSKSTRSFSVTMIKTKENENGKEYAPLGLKEIPKGFGASPNAKTESFITENGWKLVTYDYDHENDWWRIYTPSSRRIVDRNFWRESHSGTLLAKELLSLNPIDLPPLTDVEQKLVDDLSIDYPPANEKMGPQEGHGVQYINTSVSIQRHHFPKLIIRPAIKDAIFKMLNPKIKGTSKVVVTGNEGIGRSRMVELVLRELLLDYKIVLVESQHGTYAFIPPISAFGQKEYKVYNLNSRDFNDACALLYCEHVYRLIDPQDVRFPDRVPAHNKAIDIMFPENDCEVWFKEFQKTNCIKVYLCGYSLSEVYAVRSILDPKNLLSEHEIKDRYTASGGAVLSIYNNYNRAKQKYNEAVFKRYDIPEEAKILISTQSLSVSAVDSNTTTLLYNGLQVGVFGKFESGKLRVYTRWVSHDLENYEPLVLKYKPVRMVVSSLFRISENHYAPFLISAGYQVEFFDKTIPKLEIKPLEVKQLEGDVNQILSEWSNLNRLAEINEIFYCYQPNPSGFVHYFFSNDSGIYATMGKSVTIDVPIIVQILANLNGIKFVAQNNSIHSNEKIINALLGLKGKVKKFTLILFLQSIHYDNFPPPDFEWHGIFRSNQNLREELKNLIIHGKSTYIPL